MVEKLKKPNYPPAKEPEQLTKLNLAGERTEKRSDVENLEPVGESEVTIAEAYQGTTGHLSSTALQNSSTARPTNTRGTAESVPLGRGTAAGVTPAREEATSLFSPDESMAFRTHWDSIQVEFVDEPRRCVEQADNLVAETMKRLAEIFAEERERLEHEWDRGGDVSTEDLRQALRRYRSFFGRLLSV
jgi:hypothetical protein